MIDLLKKIFINQVFWYVASRYGIMALQFIASLFTAVRLGVYNYGLWSFITLLTTLGGCLNLGIGNAATVFLVQNKKSRRLTNAYTCNSFFLACLTGALSFSVLLYDRLFGITLFEKYHLGFYIYFVCSIIFFQQICTYFINIMRIKNKLFPIMFFQSLWPLCMLAVLFMAEGKALLHLLVWSLLLTSVISSVIFFQQAKIFWQDFLNLRLIERILKKGIFMFFFNTCFLMITYSTQLIISNHFSVKEFGYFSFALILANGIILLVDSIIFILYPAPVARQSHPTRTSHSSYAVSRIQ